MAAMSAWTFRNGAIASVGDIAAIVVAIVFLVLNRTAFALRPLFF